MIAAIERSKQNISAFGGDPGRVTIAGQSAGAFGVNYLTVSPWQRDCFTVPLQRVVVIFMSTPQGLPWI